MTTFQAAEAARLLTTFAAYYDEHKVEIETSQRYNRNGAEYYVQLELIEHSNFLRLQIIADFADYNPDETDETNNNGLEVRGFREEIDRWIPESPDSKKYPYDVFRYEHEYAQGEIEDLVARIGKYIQEIDAADFYSDTLEDAPWEPCPDKEAFRIHQPYF